MKDTKQKKKKKKEENTLFFFPHNISNSKEKMADSSNVASTPHFHYLGVDIGSLRTRIASMNPQKLLPSIVRNTLSNESTATVACFPPKPADPHSRGTARLYGENAAPKAVTKPYETVTDMLEWLLGSTEASILATPSSSAETPEAYTPSDNHRYIGQKNDTEEQKAGCHQLHVVQVVSYFLQNVLLLASPPKNKTESVDASAFLSTVKLAVALPPSANPFAFRACREAAVLAGVKDENVLIASSDEAVALYFHHHQYNRLLQDEKTGQREVKPPSEGAALDVASPSLVMIVSVGASSCFVSLLHVSTTTICKVATEALSLGASELDNGLVEYVLGKIEEKFGEPSFFLRFDLKARRKIEIECRKAKEVITSNDRYHLHLDSLFNDQDFNLEITLEVLETAASSFLISLKDMLALVQQKKIEYLGSLNLPEATVPVRVEVIGGGWRSTCITNTLKSGLGIERLGTSLDANLSIAEGCSLFSFLTFAEGEEDKEALTKPPHRVLLSGFNGLPNAEAGIPLPLTVPLLTEAEKGAVACWRVAEEEFSKKDDAIHLHLVALNDFETLVLQTLSDLPCYKMEESRMKLLEEYLDAGNTYLRQEAEEEETANLVAKRDEVKEHLRSEFPEINCYYEEKKAEVQRKEEELARISRENKVEEVPKSDPQLLLLAQKRREQGTVLFKEECWAEAQSRFLQALGLLEQLYDTTSEGNVAKKKDISLSCYLNLASCSVRLELWKNAVSNCNSALEVSPNNVKAYFRRGQAYMGMREYALAVKDLEKVSQECQQDEGVLTTLSQAKKALSDEKKREKKMFAKMFA